VLHRSTGGRRFLQIQTRSPVPGEHKRSPTDLVCRMNQLRTDICLPIDDADLEAIGSFRHCEALDLGGTCISDQGIRYLSQMQSLQYLFLWHTQISDAAIDWIVRIPQLRMLSVCNTSISKTGVDKLQSSVKDCLLCLDDDRYRYGTLHDLDALRSFAES
jgi:hypothetical protein